MVRSSSRERESRSRETRLSSRASSRDLQERGAESRYEGAGASANSGGWGLLDAGGSEAANTETREVRGPLHRSGDNYSTRGRESETQKGQSVLGACSPPWGGGGWWQMLTCSQPRPDPRGHRLRSPRDPPAPAVPSAFAAPPAGTVALPAAALSADRVRCRKAGRPLSAPALTLPGSLDSSSPPSRPLPHPPSLPAPQTTQTVVVVCWR